MVMFTLQTCGPYELCVSVVLNYHNSIEIYKARGCQKPIGETCANLNELCLSEEQGSD
jgi:hypothetical protein